MRLAEQSSFRFAGIGRMDPDLFEILLYIGALGLLPYVAVEAYETVQRTIARRRGCPRH